VFTNQYFISNASFSPPSDGNLTKIGGYTIWAHRNLEITELLTNQNHLILLGFAFDSKFPEKSNQQILQDLAENPISSLEFFNYFNRLTGRFVLIAKQNGKTIVLNDAAAQRQIFYHFEESFFYATSSPKLFYDLSYFELKIPTEKQEILNSKRFKLLEEWFPGDQYLDENLKRLLPNFYLKTETNSLHRIPFSVQSMGTNELKKYVKEQIYGAMEACTLRFDKTLLGVTGGGDSRLIFSCTPHEESIEYFLFKRESENNTDLKIARELTEKKKINLSIIQPKKNSEAFLELYKMQFLKPRILSKLRNIEWLKENYESKNAVVVMGYAGEMLRNSTNSINPYHKTFQNKESFIDYLHYPRSSYLENSINNWWEDLHEYLQSCKNLLPLDLFHWEQHMAPYCAQYAFEQDFSMVETFCPLSNRQLILNIIHNTKTEERNNFILQIIDEKCPEWKGIPYNPKSNLKKLKDKIFNILPLKVVNQIINR